MDTERCVAYLRTGASWKKLGTRFSYKQHFYKQRQVEIGKKIKQLLNNTLRLNFCYLKIIYILHSRYHPKIKGHILKTIYLLSS